MSRRYLTINSQARLLLPLGAGLALSLAGDSTIYAVLPNQIDVVGINLGVVGILLGANRLIRIPGNIIAGFLNDRLGRRRLFLLGLFLGVLSTLTYSLVTGFWQLLAGRLLWGIAWALINVGGYTMIIDYSTSADRGRMTGFYQTAFMLGLTISPLAGGALTDALGFRSALRACAAISATGLGIALLALPETRQPGGERTGGTWRVIARFTLTRVCHVLRQMDRRILLASGLYMMVLFVNSGVLMSTISLYLRQRWGMAIEVGGVVVGVALLAGVMLAVRSTLGMVAGPLAGICSDRLRSRWPVVHAGLLLGIVGFLTLTLLGDVWVVFAGVALVSASTGTLAAALTALVGDAAEDDRPGVTMGGLATAGDIGSATGPLLAYALAASTDLRWAYGACAAALSLGLLAAAAGRRAASRGIR